MSVDNADGDHQPSDLSLLDGPMGIVSFLLAKLILKGVIQPMWSKRRGRRSQSVKAEKNQYGFPVIEFNWEEEWEEEIHFPIVDDPPKEERKKSSFRNRLRSIAGTIFLGLITNSLYDHLNWSQFLILFVHIKTATILVAAWDYMVSVLAKLHVVILSLF